MTVSVVITCFNEGAYIAEAVESVLAQTTADKITDIAIVDAGSEASTLEVLAAVAGRDPRIAVHRLTGAGVSRSRNVGVANTRGRYIAFLDGDDAWLPSKLERQLAAMEVQKDVGLCYTGYFACSPHVEAREMRVRDLSTEADAVRSYFLDDPPVLPSSVIVRRLLYTHLHGFDEKVQVFEDTEFLLRFLERYKALALPEPLIRKRYRLGSLTSFTEDLLSHHALVAFKFAEERQPRLLPDVPGRLSVRARRLGTMQYYEGKVRSARLSAQAALKMNIRNGPAWILLLAALGGPLLRSILDRPLRSRALVHKRG